MPRSVRTAFGIVIWPFSDTTVFIDHDRNSDSRSKACAAAGRAPRAHRPRTDQPCFRSYARIAIPFGATRERASLNVHFGLPGSKSRRSPDPATDGMT